MTQAPSRRGCALFPALLIILLGVIAGLYPWATADPIPRDPTLIPGTPIPDAVRYVVVPAESSLGLELEAMIGRVSGQAEMNDGTVELVREGDGWRVVASLTMNVSTLNVGNEMVNGLIRRALGVEEYPSGVFLATSTTTLPAITDGTYNADLAGQLELRGAVRPYTFHATLAFEGEQLVLDAKATVQAQDFGVSVPRIVGSGVMQSTMHVVAIREGATPGN